MTYFSISVVILLLNFGSLSALDIDGCPLISVFNADNINDLKGEKLEKVFSKGRFLGKGSFGLVKEIRWGDKRAATKEITIINDPIFKMILEREILHMKLLSGKNSISDLFGCALDRENQKVYLIQELLYKDLDTPSVAKKIRALPFHKRLLRYIKLAEMFQKLHEESITHQDIKSANIMSVNNKLNDFRIIDLGFSVKVNEPTVGGSPFFNAPEKVNKENVIGNVKKPATSQIFATFAHDIYALGITLILKESSIQDIFGDVPTSCYLFNFVSYCSMIIHKNVRALLKGDGQDKFAEILIKATAFDNFKRTYSMEDLKNEMIALYNEISKVHNLPAITDAESLDNLLSSKFENEAANRAYEISMSQKEYTMNDASIKEDEKLIQFPVNEKSEELVDDMTNPVSDYFNYLKMSKVETLSKTI